MNIDFPALFDEVMDGYEFGEVTDGHAPYRYVFAKVTDDLAPYRYVFALDRAINCGEQEELQRLLKASVPPPLPCIPALGVALSRLNPEIRRKRTTALGDYDRFNIVLRYQAATGGGTPSKVAIIELAKHYSISRDSIRKIWEKRQETFPGLTF